jgi:hypothetical protein
MCVATFCSTELRYVFPEPVDLLVICFVRLMFVIFVMNIDVYRHSKKATKNLNEPMPIDDEDDETDKNIASDDPSTTALRARTCCRQVRLCKDFHVENLKGALAIIDEIKSFDSNYVTTLQTASALSRYQHRLPTQMLELIVKSPVFYNTNLLPNCRFKYQSQFKRAQFCDGEKM